MIFPALTATITDLLTGLVFAAAILTICIVFANEARKGSGPLEDEHDDGDRRAA